MTSDPSTPLPADDGPGTTDPPPVPRPASVPESARGPAIPDKGYLRQEIGDALHLVTNGSFQMMFLVTDEGVVAVDAPPLLAGSILPAIAEVTSAPVTHVVYSHHHADHIGAAGIYPPSAVRYAHRDAAAVLARLGDRNRPLPTVTVDDHLTVEVAGQVLELAYHGPNHSPGNLFVHAPRQRALMLVDVIFPGWVPFDSLGQSSDIPGWVDAHEQALGYDFDTFVGGHLTRVGTREDVRVQQDYVADLRTTIETTSADLDLQAVFGSVADPTNLWELFNAFTDAVASAATDSVVPRWTDRLGGAAVYTRSNVLTMAEALRIDYGTLG